MTNTPYVAYVIVTLHLLHSLCGSLYHIDLPRPLSSIIESVRRPTFVMHLSVHFSVQVGTL